jgi:hypothetical protein
MTSSMVATALWHNPYDNSSELCHLLELQAGFRLEGLVLVPFADAPARVDYHVEVDDQWRSRRVEIRMESATLVKHVALFRGAAGQWILDGKRLKHLDGCIDVDFRLTPSTNTLPIRRLAPAVGDVVETRAAWIGFPELEVVASKQSYERLSRNGYRFRANSFEADILVDDAGFVLRYGEELWRAVAHRFSGRDRSS